MQIGKTFFDTNFIIVFALLIIVLFTSTIFGILLKNKGKIWLIPFLIFVTTCFTIIFSIFQFGITYKSIFEENHCAYDTPEQIVEIGNNYVLYGYLSFNELQESFQPNAFGEYSEIRDSIAENYAYFYLDTPIDSFVSSGNIIFIDSALFAITLSQYNLKDLRANNKRIEMSIKCKKLGLNEWLALDIIWISKNEGITPSFIDD